jgi:hypothetical protein
MKRSLRRSAARTAIVIVAGLAAFAAGALVVNAATTAQQSAKKTKKAKGKASFRIRTKVAGQLQPGARVPIQISLANNRPKPVWIKRLKVVIAVDKAHAAAGCSAARDYSVEQIPNKFFPYKLVKKPRVKASKHKRKKVKTHWKPLSTAKRQGKPTLSMNYLPEVNQDACKGATVTIAYRSQSSMKKPRKVAKKK